MTYTDLFGRQHRYGPPATAVPLSGTVTFNAEQEWGKLCVRGLKFPHYEGPSSLSRVVGDCLYPLLVEGKHQLRIAPMGPDDVLVDGGLYVLELGGLAHSSLAEELRAKFNLGENFVICKILRWIVDEWYVVFKDGMSPLSRYGAVVAQVVAVLPLIAPLTGCAPTPEHTRQDHVCNNPFDAASPACASIDPNAVSTIGSANSATNVASGGAINVNTNTTVISLTVTTTGAAVEVDASCTAQILNSVGGFMTVANLKIFRDGSAVSGAEWDPTNGGSSGNLNSTTMPQSQQVTLTVTDAPAAGSHTYSLVMNTTWSHSTSGIASLNCFNNFIKVREIKR